MLIKDYKLREFRDEFNSKVRKPTVEHSDKYRHLKQELTAHLKPFGKKLKVFNDLNFYVEGNTLFMTYKETTQQRMKLTFLWRVNNLDQKDIEKMVEDFCINDLKMEKEDLPKVQIDKAYTRQNLAIYWQDTKTISTSIYTINQLEEAEVLSVIKHECIHHYLSINGKDPADTSEEFIDLIIEHDAYVSKDEDAYNKYEEHLNNKEKLETNDYEQLKLF